MKTINKVRTVHLQDTKVDVKVLLGGLWISMLFVFAYVDVFGFWRADVINGALVGSLILGLLDNFGRALFPDLSYFTLFVPMIIILAFRPGGLVPRG